MAKDSCCATGKVTVDVVFHWSCVKCGTLTDSMAQAKARTAPFSVCRVNATSTTSVRPSVTLVDCDHVVQQKVKVST